MQTDKEQTEISVSKIGKFNTADDLLSAYNALQSEFTKRCQLIKQLQAELDAMRAQEDDTTEQSSHDTECGMTEVADEPSQSAVLREETPTAASSSVTDEHEVATAPAEADKVICVTTRADCETAVAASTEQLLDEIAAHAADYAELLSAIPEIMDACVARYKHKLMGTRGSASPAGMAVIMPAKRPRSLYEAKLLADELLSK